MTLVGPPEIHHSLARTAVSLAKTAVSSPSSTVASHPFMDAMISSFNSTYISPKPPMGYTENMSPTYLSTGNPCLDFFFHVVPDTPPETITRHLQQSWEHDPLKTLKLICNLHGVRGTGKSDKEGYYTSTLWLHEKHPKTLAYNVAFLAEFAYLKDLPELLHRLLEGPDVRITEKEERNSWDMMSMEKKKEYAIKNTRKLNRITKASKVIERYNHDPDYKLLHESISDLFTDLLRSDIKFLTEGESSQIRLAAKWCPSLYSSFDKSTLLCETIAKKIFPLEEYPEYNNLEEAHYAYHVRNRLRKQILVPLRKALDLPEVYIGQNQWGQIPYDRVASLAMKLYEQKFLTYDGWRFNEYLHKVVSGKATIEAGAFLPHEIISCLKDGDSGHVSELQWMRMVNDMLMNGKLNNCLTVCDVSASMLGTPMEVSVALGVLVSELSEEPWKGHLITFSQYPKMQKVQGKDLKSKTEFVKRMDWGMNTDFQKVFDLILEVASRNRLSEDEMIKRVFVFSDMEFDQASSNPWETDYHVIKRKFTEKGYGGAVPEIVFWNLRDLRATPVARRENGVALVSGFSKNLMTLFMEDGGDMNPESVMDLAISGESITNWWWLINNGLMMYHSCHDFLLYVSNKFFCYSMY